MHPQHVARRRGCRRPGRPAHAGGQQTEDECGCCHGRPLSPPGESLRGPHPLVQTEGQRQSQIAHVGPGVVERTGQPVQAVPRRPEPHQLPESVQRLRRAEGNQQPDEQAGNPSGCRSLFLFHYFISINHTFILPIIGGNISPCTDCTASAALFLMGIIFTGMSVRTRLKYGRIPASDLHPRQCCQAVRNAVRSFLFPLSTPDRREALPPYRHR